MEQARVQITPRMVLKPGTFDLTTQDAWYKFVPCAPLCFKLSKERGGNRHECVGDPICNSALLLALSGLPEWKVPLGKVPPCMGF